MSTAVKSFSQDFLRSLQQKAKDYAVLVKVTLNLTVVFSAVFGYLLASGMNFTGVGVVAIMMGGFLVTSSANALNQIFEKDYDRLMKRTANRPLATGRMHPSEAFLIAGISGVAGLLILWYFFNPTTALLGAISLISYAFIYTPLKRYSTVAVFVGAIPGALPPAIGWVAFTGSITMEAHMLFAIQFLWQFPHFWAIGWLGYEDYKKAGFKLLRIDIDGRNRQTAMQIIVYIVGLMFVAVMPFIMGLTGKIALVVSLVLGMYFLYQAVVLYKKCDNPSALKVMYASLFYLPLMQIIMIIDKV